MDDDETVATAEAVVEHEIERRNRAGNLTAPDRNFLRRSRIVREQRADGLSYEKICREFLTDVDRAGLSRYVNSPLHAACLRIIDGPISLIDKEDAEDALKRAKHLLAMTLPDAVEYLRTCLWKDPSTGKPMDQGLAQWATQEVLKLGALKSEGAHQGAQVVLTAEAMRTLLGAIKGDDAKRAPSVTVTVTPEITHVP